MNKGLTEKTSNYAQQYPSNQNKIDQKLDTSKDQSIEIYNQELLQNGVDVKWCELKISGKNIPRRSYHVAVTFKDSLYLYGGHEVVLGILDDFYEMKLTNYHKFHWKIIYNKQIGKYPANYPGQLCRQSANVYENEMYMFGGLRSQLKNTNEMWKYNFESNIWSSVSYQSKLLPPSIDSHATEIYNNQLVVFGGFITSDQGGYTNQLMLFDFKTLQWSFLGSKQQQPAPKPRAGAAISIMQDKLYMFGGSDIEKKFNDLWVFDLVQHSWSKIDTKGYMPEERNGHSLTNYGDKLVLFGGIHDITHEKNDLVVFDTQKMNWKVIDEDNSHKSEMSKEEQQQLLLQNQFQSNHKQSHLFDSSQLQSSIYNNKKRKPDIYKVGQFSPSKRQYMSMRRSSEILGEKQYNKSQMSKINVNQMEEMRRKQFLLKKKHLLSEFDLSKDEQVEFQTNSPTTEKMRSQCSSLYSQQTSQQLNKKFYTQSMHNSNNTSKFDFKTNRIIGRRPGGRDGHSAINFQGSLIIFGGDRHLMAYNDLFVVDLEVITGCNQLPPDKKFIIKTINSFENFNQDHILDTDQNEEQNNIKSNHVTDNNNTNTNITEAQQTSQQQMQ